MKKLAHQRPAKPRYADAPAVDLNVLAGRPSVNFTHDAAAAPVFIEPLRERVESRMVDGRRLTRWRCPKCGHLCAHPTERCPECEKIRSDNAGVGSPWRDPA